MSSAKQSPKFTEAEIKHLADLLRQGHTLPVGYQDKLISARHPELIWEGKNRVFDPLPVLPFQTIEQVDEPRNEGEHTYYSDDLHRVSGKQIKGWHNKLIWGDNKYILSSLAGKEIRKEIERNGGIKLIYIDPPFDVGADFKYEVNCDGSDITKQPSVLEEIAYRDTWGSGSNSYLSMMHERLELMKDLLADDGTIYVHCDWRVNGLLRLVLDEIFGANNFKNMISWRRQVPRGRKVNADFLPYSTDYIYIYAIGKGAVWNPPTVVSYLTIEEAKKKYWRDEKGFYRTSDPGSYSDAKLIEFYKEGMLYVSKGGEVVIDNGKITTTHGKINIKYYQKIVNGKVEITKAVDNLWDDVPGLGVNPQQSVGYPTQKPEKLLERIIMASSKEGDLIADFFCGSGTTAAVAEKLGRKWIASDLGKFAIHTTRKRIIETQRERKKAGEPWRPFEVLNIGKYERQIYLGFRGESESNRLQRTQKYIDLILEAYDSTPTPSFAHINGYRRAEPDRYVKVGPVSHMVTESLVDTVLAECRSQNILKVDILGFEFTSGLEARTKEKSKQAKVKVRLRRIPREVFDQRAKEDLRFDTLAWVNLEASVTPSRDGSNKEIVLKLIGFGVEIDPSELRTSKKTDVLRINDQEQLVRYHKIKSSDEMEETVLIDTWDGWIDYWAVDFDFGTRQETLADESFDVDPAEKSKSNFIFENRWQSYRTRGGGELELTTAKVQAKGTNLTVAVKVVDIFGNDTMRVVTIDLDSGAISDASISELVSS